MSPLAGLGVLVTRPEAQAAGLSGRLFDLGATVYRLPALDIRAPADLSLRLQAVGPVDRYDWVVFVSANAVRHGAALLNQTPTPALAAVGPATALALARAGHDVALTPADGYDSEHLLALPTLQSVHGQRILLVRGGQGRELLARTLRARGAEVVTVDVYERIAATPLPGAVAATEAAWTSGHLGVVTLTSVETAHALYEMLTPVGRSLYERTPLLVGSPRIAEAAQAMGLLGRPIVAARPDDHGLLSALLEVAPGLRQPKSSA